MVSWWKYYCTVFLDNFFLNASTMAMKYVKRCVVKPACVCLRFYNGLACRGYFYHLIYISINSILHNTSNGWNQDVEIWLQEGKWTHDGHLEVTPIGKQIRCSAKFILGWELKISDCSETFLGTNCNWLHAFFMLLTCYLHIMETHLYSNCMFCVIF